MDHAFHAASSASPSGDETLCIDPQLLRLDGNHAALASPSTMNTVSTAENNFAIPGVVSDETTAGRRMSGADASLHGKHHTGTGPVDQWSKHSATHPKNYELDPSTATIPAGAGRAAKHKHTFVSCCAERCEQTFFRKDHLTQHIRNKHQGLDTKFYCPIVGCTNHRYFLNELFEHMKHNCHKGDVHFNSIRNAAQAPKCSCGEGLIIFGRCKACGFHLV